MDDHLMAMDRAGGQIALVEEPSSTEMSESGLSADHDDSHEAPPEPTPAHDHEAASADEQPDLSAPADEPSAKLLSEDDGAEVDPAQVVEALLFASDAPLSAGRLAELAGAGTPSAIRKHIKGLNDKYASTGLSFRIDEIAGGYRMLTLPIYRTWLVKLNKQRSRSRLSAAALETLSIIAYKQPIIRAEVDAIRGVSCGEAINRLREMGMVKIVGRAEMVGRPMLYGTTRKFLDTFGLASLDELPPLEALTLRPAQSNEQDASEDDDAAAASA